MCWGWNHVECASKKLCELTEKGIITLGRGEVIPKQGGKYPVYSSSAQNNGLFCYRDSYSFDEELISWSVDGGGKPFLRRKHKYSLTNVCGFARINNFSLLSYTWLYVNFWYSWHKLRFDYTTKAHPSVISKLYKVKLCDIKYQKLIEVIIESIDNKIDILEREALLANKLKKCILKEMFI